MDRFQRPLGPTPGALRVQGMGGPGAGMTNLPTAGPNGGLLDWLAWQAAGGLGLGPYGYALGLGTNLGSQQNLLLNQQWGIPGLGTHYEYAREVPYPRRQR